MESTEFDATLGGKEHLPYSASTLKFAKARSVEIAAMTESILRPSKTKLIFQTLPVHMRRRVMSHNCKRLPRKLREGHLEQMKKSGLPPKQKRPSRKYRRRPNNLLGEYTKRQNGKAVWLETHIWHAKRFHMIERWKFKMAYAPCDKAFRACYRATSAHCLMQDMSFYTIIKVQGPLETVKKLFSSITNTNCGLNICAKAYLNGKRSGIVHLYHPNRFPFGYIGNVKFLWAQDTLFLLVHPSQLKEIKSVLSQNKVSQNQSQPPEKRRKLTSTFDDIQITQFSDSINIFRLTGPNSHAVLSRSLKCVENVDKLKTSDWFSQCKENSKMYLKEKMDYWQSVSSVGSPSQLPPSAIVGLIVKDPRLSRPSKRTKARRDIDEDINVTTLISIPDNVSVTPFWDEKVRESIHKKKITNHQFIEHITKTQLVPGEVVEDDPALQSIPVVLIQRPGSQDQNFKKIGYGSGWDIIMPAGYGLPFWQTFIMFGARPGGIRETESLHFELGECYLPPDSEAGKTEAKRVKFELQEKYFKLPPSKRVNYVKLAINSPFICQWKILLRDWSTTVQSPESDFFILRNRILLNQLQQCLANKKPIPSMDNSDHCLVAVYLHIEGKGNLKRHALICKPEPNDFSNIKAVFEPHHDDPNEKIRKQKRSEHIKAIKKARRKWMKTKKKGITITKAKRKSNEPSEYVKAMRELWVPSFIENVRYSSSRQILGYLSQGAFSFSEHRSCGIGYIAYNALAKLIQIGNNKVLVRNTSSRKYILASIKVISG